MSLLNNAASIHTTRFILGVGSRCVIEGRHHLPAPGTPALLAVSHLSHYDPVVVGGLLRRKIDWLARAEFYRTPAARWACTHCDCIELDRYGHALPGMRQALDRLRQGRLVGIFPEGEIILGPDSALSGGPVRGGVALLSRRAQVPIVPCVVINSDQLRRVTPWLPLKQGRLWISLGQPIMPDPDARPGRASRRRLADRVAEALRDVYRSLCDRHDIPPQVGP